MGFSGVYVLAVVLVVKLGASMLFGVNLNWIGMGLLVAGWGVGYILPGIEKYFGTGRLKEWVGQAVVDRYRSPIKNVLTGGLVAVLALWMLASSGSSLGVGVVTGLTVRLFVDYLNEKNRKVWYWIFVREFSGKEMDNVKILWGALVAVILIGLVK
jgi:hypothetical protein